MSDVIYANRVHEACSGTGSANLTLLGALSGKATFTSKIPTGSVVPYVLLDGNGVDWEVGFGTLASATELQRTTVKDSSATADRVNSEADGTPVKISLTANQHEVFIAPFDKTVFSRNTDGGLADPSAVRAAIFVNTIAAMTALAGLEDGEAVIVMGGAALADGDGGVYYWDPDDATAENPPATYEHDTETGLFKRVRFANIDDDAIPLTYLETSTSLASNSDTRVPSTKAVKAYADALIAANDAMVFRGVIDCSANPNYPAADRGDTYRVSVAGKIGGASGLNVEAGDLLLCLTDSTASGTQAGVGASWTIAQTNLDGGVIGPASATDNGFALFDGTSGKLLKSTGITLDTDTSLTANSDTRIPSQAAVKAYVDAINAISASGDNDLSGENTISGRLLLDVTAAAYDIEATLATFIHASPGVSISVPAGDQLALIRWDQLDGATITVGNGSESKFISFELEIDAASHSTSNAYGVIGALYSASPGSAKALYGRVVGTGSTGPLVAIVAGITPGSGTSASMGVEIEGDSTAKAVNWAIRVGSNLTPSDATFDYGLMLTADVIIQQAVLQANAHASHTGVFARIRDTDNSTVLFQTDFAGITSGAGFRPVTNGGAALGTATLRFSALHLDSASVINWNNGDLTLTHSSNTLQLSGGDLQLYSQASLHLNNVTRNYSWQAQTSPDRVRLLVGSLGDALYILANGTMEPQYNVNIPTGKRFQVAGNNIIGDRKTGWALPTGTRTRTTFDTATVTLPQLAERFYALLNDLHSGGSDTPTHALFTT